ncbi:hypothetical protein AB6A40_007182 [Gnathostoma spinigerum]|uniref:Hemicentin-1 n=1 Tax=Gnathostoma spinigerum TaxID=75299 RepID=A0ABD6ETV5_9BILA
MEIHRGQELQSCYLGNPACPHSFPVYPCGAPGPIYGIIGPQCPPLSQPMEWGEWRAWTPCSATCGLGITSRSRPCKTGICIGVAKEWQYCQNPTPCETWSSWTKWSQCSVTCGQGERIRRRYCLLGEGRCQGYDAERMVCHGEYGAKCDEWGHWSSWSQCSATCGEGRRTRYRSCRGERCPGPKSQSERCYLAACPGPEWSAWLDWSACSVTCGRGIRQRSRTCVNGQTCPGSSVETEECVAARACAAWSTWGAWSSCSNLCGQGEMTRRRECLTPNGVESYECVGSAMESQTCSERSGCVSWGAWSGWSECSNKCGYGTMTRKRECVDVRGYSASGCQGMDTDTKTCSEKSGCASWGTWLEWSGCSTNCGEGTMTRRRDCLDSNGYPATSCEGMDMDTRTCSEKSGCASWGTWLEWSGCSTNCGEGTMTRKRDCLDSSGYSTTGCEGMDTDTQSCSEKSGCASWGEWLEWSECSTNCGEGTMTRKRDCLDSSGYSTTGCEGMDTDTQTCSEKSGCASWGTWLEWSGCSTNCGEGTMTRRRECVDSSGYSTTGCEGTDTDTRTCSEKSGCASWGAWLEWSGCSTNCGEGTMTRRRECLDSSGYSTTGCEGTDTDTQTCSEKSGCASWGTWLEWSGCSTNCGEGTMTRRRDCLDSSGYSTVGCEGMDTDTQTCTEKSGCASWGAWLEWSGCSSSCGEGTMTRHRECVDSSGYPSSNCEGVDTVTSALVAFSNTTSETTH